MTKIDLITGFLGSGKTSFIKKYARHFIDKGENVGILENDYGAVNVDMMLLSELEGERCSLETVAGACDADCHKRRFKTKLIALGMSGFDRVIVEPSGIFDVDEFFDTLREEPLDRWFEIGCVLVIADAASDDVLSEASRRLLGSQAANAGAVVMSKTQLVSEERVQEKTDELNFALESVGCSRRLGSEVFTKPWSELCGDDFERLSQSGWVAEDFVKYRVEDNFSTLYFMNSPLSPSELVSAAEKALSDSECGSVFRVKGFAKENGNWFELNSTKKQSSLTPIKNGQSVVIVIGERLNEEKISQIFEPEKTG